MTGGVGADSMSELEMSEGVALVPRHVSAYVAGIRHWMFMHVPLVTHHCQAILERFITNSTSPHAIVVGEVIVAVMNGPLAFTQREPILERFTNGF